MEQIKLHKQGGAAVIIIPAVDQNTGWEDGTLLDVLEINEAPSRKKDRIRSFSY